MSRSLTTILAVAAVCVFGSLAQAATVSTMRRAAVAPAAQNYRIVPVAQVRVAGDESPAIVYEILRPQNERITLSRLHTSCSCVQLEAAKATFEPGERALVTLRNVRPTPPQGQLYSFYIQLASPQRVTLQQDTFVQSDRFRSHAAVPAGYRVERQTLGTYW